MSFVLSSDETKSCVVEGEFKRGRRGRHLGVPYEYRFAQDTNELIEPKLVQMMKGTVNISHN